MSFIFHSVHRSDTPMMAAGPGGPTSPRQGRGRAGISSNGELLQRGFRFFKVGPQTQCSGSVRIPLSGHRQDGRGVGAGAERRRRFQREKEATGSGNVLNKQLK